MCNPRERNEDSDVYNCRVCRGVGPLGANDANQLGGRQYARRIPSFEYRDFVAGTPMPVFPIRLARAERKERLEPNPVNLMISPASTQTTEWKEFFDAANRLRREGRFVDAEKAYLAAVTKAEALGATDPRLASTLSNLAGLFRDKGRYAEAVGMYHRSVAIYQVTDGRKSPEASGVLNNLALTYTLQGRYSAAEVLYQEALANFAESLPAQHADVASTLSNLGLLHLKQGRYTKAETLYRQALTMRENLLGPDHPQVGDSLNDVASALFGRSPLGRGGSSVPTIACYSGKEPSGHITLLSQLPSITSRSFTPKTGRYAEAEPLYRRSLAIVEKLLGPDHPDTAGVLSNLGQLCYWQGRYAESEPLLKRALKIRERALGVDHIEVAINLNALAELYRMRREYVRAEPLYRQALSVAEKAVGAEHPLIAQLLCDLGELFSALGYGEKAERLYVRSIRMTENLHGQGHLSAAVAMEGLGVLYVKRGRHSEAGRLFERSIAIKQQTLGPQNPALALPLAQLATLFLAKKPVSGGRGHLQARARDHSAGSRARVRRI